MDRVHILTVATSPGGYLELLKYTLPPIKILANGAKWHGFMTKIYHVFNELNTIRPTDIVIFCDAYDVIYNNKKNLLDLIEEFESLNVDILFSCTDHTTSILLIKYLGLRIFNMFKNEDKYLGFNPGLYMGYANSLQCILKDLLEYQNYIGIDDDERLLNSLIKKNSSYQFDDHYRLVYNSSQEIIIGLDYNCKIFKNYLNLNTYSNIYNILTSQAQVPIDIIDTNSAYFHHFVGNQQVVGDNILLKFKQSRPTLFSKIITYAKYIMFEIIFVSILLFFIFYFFIINRKQ